MEELERCAQEKSESGLAKSRSVERRLGMRLSGVTLRKNWFNFAKFRSKILSYFNE